MHVIEAWTMELINWRKKIQRLNNQNINIILSLIHNIFIMT